MSSSYLNLVNSKIDDEKVLLNDISQELWKNPELKYEENRAHDLLTRVLLTKGFHVQRNYLMSTAFRAEYSSGIEGPTVAVLCEYDALPEIGHACGHNLIAEAGIGAGLGIKATMEAEKNIPGKVVVLGTPAEEGGGGKIELINKGAFKDIDVALMVHPSPTDHLYPPFIAIRRVNVRYIGQEAHASGYPWEGRNALDAAVACYSNVALLRQHIKPTCRIHGIISNGGAVPNVIPGLSELKFYFRASTSKDLEDLEKRLFQCFTSAAEATGCEVTIEPETSDSYDALISNTLLAELYGTFSKSFGTKFADGNPRIISFMASSDIGNVSRVVPSIHPTYSIGTNAANHSKAFTIASGATEAQPPTLIAAKSMALAALEVMNNPSLLSSIKDKFFEDLNVDCI